MSFTFSLNLIFRGTRRRFICMMVFISLSAQTARATLYIKAAILVSKLNKFRLIHFDLLYGTYFRFHFNDIGLLGFGKKCTDYRLTLWGEKKQLRLFHRKLRFHRFTQWVIFFCRWHLVQHFPFMIVEVVRSGRLLFCGFVQVSFTHAYRIFNKYHAKYT